ncbi:MAG: tat pathway signal sequence [Dactylosporangium sp.]|nr:hypothetical protein [Dactylosporangium sp.]NNJ60401.1 tat pathway signal sequence [Dactylosporangium sp.]
MVVGVTVVAAGGQSGTSRWAAPIAAPPSGPAASAGSAGSSPAGSPSPSPLASCPPNTGWDCAQQRRFAAANALLADSPGKLGVIVHDRNTNAVWRAGTTANTTWTASTIKLAIVATILEWHREGKISITDTDRANMSAALVDSSNAATTTLWARYGGQPMFHRFRSKYEMTSLSVVSGYELFWRNLRCNAEDLHHLMLYILNDLYLDDRAYLIGKLRGVGANQQWGVWAAGSALRPGNKNGWAQKPDSGSNRWVTHTVGFAGPSECYIVVITYSQPPSGTLSKGIHTVSDLAATIFAATVPARVVTP